MIMVNCAFSWFTKEASKAKGEHDPNIPSSVLLAFLLQTSSASCFQWYVCVPHAALATAACCGGGGGGGVFPTCLNFVKERYCVG